MNRLIKYLLYNPLINSTKLYYNPYNYTKEKPRNKLKSVESKKCKSCKHYYKFGNCIRCELGIVPCHKMKPLNSCCDRYEKRRK